MRVVSQRVSNKAKDYRNLVMAISTMDNLKAIDFMEKVSTSGKMERIIMANLKKVLGMVRVFGFLI